MPNCTWVAASSRRWTTFGHRGDLRLVAPGARGLVGQPLRHVVEPLGVERLGRADLVVALRALGGSHRRPEDEPLHAETFGGELTVIGDGLGRGVLVVQRRLVGLAHRLGGAAAPILGPGDRQRRVGGDCGEGEMLGRLGRVAEEAQGDPAGVELAIDFARRLLGRRRPDAEVERQPRLVEIEELARHHAPLVPPAVRIDERVAVGRREAEQGRRLVGPAGAPRVLDAGEEKSRIALQRVRRRDDERRGQRPVRRDVARDRKLRLVRPGEHGRPAGGGPALRIEQAVGAVFVIGERQRRPELAQDRRLGPGVEIAVAPERTDRPDRLADAAGGAERAGERQLAGARLRRGRGEERDDVGRRARMDDEVRLLASAQIALGRPARMSGGEGLQRIGARLRIGAQRRPFERQAPVGVGLGPSQGGKGGDVAFAVGDDGGRKRRRRALLRRLGDRTVGRERREGAPDERGHVLSPGLGRRLGLADPRRGRLRRLVEARPASPARSG